MIPVVGVLVAVALLVVAFANMMFNEHNAPEF